MHTTAFIITSREAPPDREPSDQELREAAKEAIMIAQQSQTDPEGTNFESFSLGCRQRRHIQGQFYTNAEQRDHGEPDGWDEDVHPIMSQVREPDLSDEGLAAIPAQVLRNGWNRSQNLEIRPESPGWDER